MNLYEFFLDWLRLSKSHLLWKFSCYLGKVCRNLISKQSWSYGPWLLNQWPKNLKEECETLNAGETEYSPESAKEQALDGFF